jgi:3-isopropylmalate dehydrogenase
LTIQRRLEAGLLGILKALKLFANLCPAYLYPELKDACPLKAEVAEKGYRTIDIVKTG